MADEKKGCMTCGGGMCGGKGIITLKEGAWSNNPLAIQMLGICSALAVTSSLANSLVMGVALIFVCVGSNLFVSLLRAHTPPRIRMIAEVAIIATFVIIFDQILKAYFWEMSKQLGPYVALIITNCIVMGRAEAFALQNPPMLSIVDGFANGIGYAVVLAVIGIIRELFGTGSIMGLWEADWYVGNLIMVSAPGAFIVMGFVVALFNKLKGPDPEENK